MSSVGARRVFGGLLLYSVQIAFIGHVSELCKIGCRQQRFITLTDFIEPIVGVDD
jgi:hypothetical protein